MYFYWNPYNIVMAKLIWCHCEMQEANDFCVQLYLASFFFKLLAISVWPHRLFLHRTTPTFFHTAPHHTRTRKTAPHRKKHTALFFHYTWLYINIWIYSETGQQCYFTRLAAAAAAAAAAAQQQRRRQQQQQQEKLRKLKITIFVISRSMFKLESWNFDMC